MFNSFQIVICQVLNLVWLPLMLTPSLCLLPADPTRVNLVSTSLFVSGIVSSLQSVLGLRYEYFTNYNRKLMFFIFSIYYIISCLFLLSLGVKMNNKGLVTILPTSQTKLKSLSNDCFL